jgi:hypothetical protein
MAGENGTFRHLDDVCCVLTGESNVLALSVDRLRNAARD